MTIIHKSTGFSSDGSGIVSGSDVYRQARNLSFTVESSVSGKTYLVPGIQVFFTSAALGKIYSTTLTFTNVS